MFTSASSEKMASDYRSGRVFEPCTLCGRCNHRACSQHGRTMTAADQYGESGKSPKLRGKSRYDASLRLSVAPMMDRAENACFSASCKSARAICVQLFAQDWNSIGW